MGDDGVLAEPDPELARKCYPSGEKNEAIGYASAGAWR
jgi:hypothetical protein